MPVEVRTISNKKIFETAPYPLVRSDQAYMIGRWFCRVRVYGHKYSNEEEPGDSKYPAQFVAWPSDDLRKKGDPRWQPR